jgi:endonuclease III
MAIKTIRKRATAKKKAKPARPSSNKLKVKPKIAALRARADIKALHGDIPQWTPAEVEEAFRRFHDVQPEPKGELQHINPFTLLVAVVLSAQATDAGVNKATPALFAAADTPEKMVKLGEDKVRDFIKTIGLYRNKAKNVIALSEKLIAEHGGEVSHDCAAF